ncbi:MAG: type II toxin-antitoxin system RelE/ParE family toxin [Clostridiales bacterium]|nr:type II toxin-antitoxin system RelE/ParE family toxin [Clostridiales bacterium]
MNHKPEYSVSVDLAVSEKMLSHVGFLAKVSVIAAERLYDMLDESIAALENNPKIYPHYIPQEPVDAELRFKMCGRRYRIVFEIIGNSVFVYDIQDCRQDVDKNLV